MPNKKKTKIKKQVKPEGNAKFENGKLQTSKNNKKQTTEKKPQSSKTISVDDFLEAISDLSLDAVKGTDEIYSIKNENRVLTYVQDTRYGASFYHKVDGNWRAEKLKTKKELEAKVDIIRKRIENKQLYDASLTPFYKCAFEQCKFVSETKDAMIKHLETH